MGKPSSRWWLRQDSEQTFVAASAERVYQLLADMLGDFLFLAPRKDEVVEVLRVARRLHQLDDEPDALVGFLRGGFEQFLKAVAFAEQLLDGKHARG